MAIDIGRQAYLQLRGSIELVLLDAGIDSPDLLSQVMREVLATESAARTERQHLRRAFVTARRSQVAPARPGITYAPARRWRKRP